jgi:rhamnopyranosyl-N-acetylglucosaminyl-diphospho-decaprenol beta-1,3/1,4-galactofuranosyltransferase
VLVTYNRKDLLLKAIASVQRQTRALDAVIVIDNHSTDGTAELLRERHPEIEVLRQPFNSGSAGGFHAALKAGYDRGFDWIWLMDDDIELVPNGLEEMLKYQHVSKFIQGRRQGPDTMIHLEAMWDASSGVCLTLASDISFERFNREWISVQWGCFEGPLVHRSVVDQVGLPDERFFLSGDDQMYGLAASFCTNVIYLKFIILNRQLAYPNYATPLRWYLMLRNRFLVFEHLKGYSVPVNWLVFRFAILTLALWSIRHILTGGNGPNQRWESVKMVIAGVRDGWAGRFGRPAFLRD